MGHRTKDKEYKKGASVQDKRYTQNQQTAQQGASHSRAGRCTPDVPSMSCAYTKKEHLWIVQLIFINTDNLKPASPQCNAVLYKRGVGYEADIDKPEVGWPSMRDKMMARERWKIRRIQTVWGHGSCSCEFRLLQHKKTSASG